MTLYQNLKNKVPLSFTKHFLISLLGVIIVKAFSILSLPVFTNFLSVEEFGVWSIFFNTFTIISTVMMLGMNAPILRYFPKHLEKETTGIFLDSIYTVLAACSLSILTLLFLFRTFLCRLINIESQYAHYFVWVGIGAVFFTSMNAGLYFFRVKKAFWANAGYMVFQTALFVLSAIAALNLGWGISGIIGALTASFILPGIYIPFRHGFWNRLRIDWRLMYPCLALGLPAMLHALSLLGNAFSDRYLIQTYLGSEQVALYGLPCNLMLTLLNFMMLPLNMALCPHIVKIWERDQKEAEKKLRLTLRIYSLLTATMIIGMNIIIRPVVIFLSNPVYLRDLNVLPTFSVGIFCLGVYNVLSVYYLLHEKLGLFVIFNILGWVLNVTLNVLLLPRIGVFGSAIASALSHFFIFCLCFAGVLYLLGGRKEKTYPSGETSP